MNGKNQYTDEELLAQLKIGAVWAFTELYERYWDRMLYVAITKLKSKLEAEEVVQDIFASLWTRRSDLHIIGSFSAYMATAVKYKILNLLAKERRLNAYCNYKNHTAINLTTCTEDAVTFDDLRAHLSKKVGELPQKGRLAFQLSREAGLSHKEIAQEMKISEKAVERNIARSVRTLYLSMRHLLTSI